MMDGSQKKGPEEHLHMVTPLLESWTLSQVAGTTVYLKLENIQPTGSFKIRGIGHFCQEVAKKGCKHLVCSSGGNAGVAAAYAARKLGIPATIVLPKGANPNLLRRLERERAEVQMVGKVWDDANLKAQELVKTYGWVEVHPFDHPLIWEGHGSMIHELKDTLGTQPGAIILSVGGGGLLAGVVAGMKEVGWQDVPIIAMETRGADCFNQAIRAGKLVTLPDITSLAKCLGAKTAAARALECIHECQIISVVVDDEDAIQAIERFLDDERMLVEPACGAALAALYSGCVGQLQAEGRLSSSLGSIVVIVCGGNSIHRAELRALRAQLDGNRVALP
ncbi:serine dehydratase-like [Monodelphis domestica]|uniref:L-serine deaminase n=1 Tax=Monodelphis domestica TaxID=13616 RepID=F7G139_MONDO|nr:serine dehydratase-like [Monodelphis domestica]XP_007490062.1 serine dehydratase-like [Monodelphis domestica]XP_007490063.1 serine dehydratase-like [Monodelphis domestica]XP_056677667.1 serine dehydratase-like [Monodelphis domestica]XP_056677668.1 serine dehydratase-like [Monodelphis domestica]XP_056677669.1 serine dehydratase-like [Monodelphis domestica]XP_056677670.1 serine dehydratase-like [Monodelphis domestica]XP_056677671.1 serine dehydratase-like [Monodelphis domestica]XP_05667767